MTAPQILADMARSIASREEQILGLRRSLHAHPELGRAEHRTTRLVAEHLRGAGIDVTLLPGTGLVADIGATRPSRIIAARADIDALPIAEQTGLAFASVNEGVSHSCGHDIHTAALVSAAFAINEIRDHLADLGAAARFVFQPAEEVMPGGAEDVVQAGGLDGVERIFALHCDPSLDVGQIGLRVGAITAAADQVEVVLTGTGGHTSRPHLTQDLTYALAKVVTDVPAALSRRLDPRAGAALVWGSVHSGGANNVIPATGKCSGTLRMLDAQVWHGSERLVEQLVHEVVAPYGVTATVTITKGVPPVVNDAASIEAFTRAVQGAGAVPAPTPQSLGGEDFACYLEHVPGAMARLGTRTSGGPTYDLHRGDICIDEAALPIGARVLAGSVLAALALPAGEPFGRARPVVTHGGATAASGGGRGGMPAGSLVAER